MITVTDHCMMIMMQPDSDAALNAGANPTRAGGRGQPEAVRGGAAAPWPLAGGCRRCQAASDSLADSKLEPASGRLAPSDGSEPAAQASRAVTGAAWQAYRSPWHG